MYLITFGVKEIVKKKKPHISLFFLSPLKQTLGNYEMQPTPPLLRLSEGS